jgi:hypothetical protein
VRGFLIHPTCGAASPGGTASTMPTLRSPPCSASRQIWVAWTCDSGAKPGIWSRTTGTTRSLRSSSLAEPVKEAPQHRVGFGRAVSALVRISLFPPEGWCRVVWYRHRCGETARVTARGIARRPPKGMPTCLGAMRRPRGAICALAVVGKETRLTWKAAMAGRATPGGTSETSALRHEPNAHLPDPPPPGPSAWSARR